MKAFEVIGCIIGTTFMIVELVLLYRVTKVPKKEHLNNGWEDKENK